MTDTKQDTGTTRYFSYGPDEIPAIWEPGQFPSLVVGGQKRIFYDLEKFYREATAISKEEFETLSGRNA
jgi:hypothetical protein